MLPETKAPHWISPDKWPFKTNAPRDICSPVNWLQGRYSLVRRSPDKCSLGKCFLEKCSCTKAPCSDFDTIASDRGSKRRDYLSREHLSEKHLFGEHLSWEHLTKKHLSGEHLTKELTLELIDWGAYVSGCICLQEHIPGSICARTIFIGSILSLPASSNAGSSNVFFWQWTWGD